MGLSELPDDLEYVIPYAKKHGGITGREEIERFLTLAPPATMRELSEIAELIMGNEDLERLNEWWLSYRDLGDDDDPEDSADQLIALLRVLGVAGFLGEGGDELQERVAGFAARLDRLADHSSDDREALRIGPFPPIRRASAPSLHFALPERFIAVAEAEYAALDDLADGSESARRNQQEWVERGFPLEVELPEINMSFRLVPPGAFMMGSDSEDHEADKDEKPKHQVTISRPVYVGKYPITQHQWQAVMGENASIHVGKDTGRHPVSIVTWNDCQLFLRRLNDHLGQSFDMIRFPTEAEWEYACRAGTTASRYGELDRIAWFIGNTRRQGPQRVGCKLPNAWGLHDMIGNVWEWCEDVWHKNYQGAPQDGRAWTTGNPSFRVMRGGGDRFHSASCRSACRIPIRPHDSGIIGPFGCRFVLDAGGSSS